MVPFTSALNRCTSPSLSQYAIIDLNDASLGFDTNRKIPLLPIALNTNEEYGPGKPFNDFMKSPSSSTITGFEQIENASMALYLAISFTSSA